MSNYGLEKLSNSPEDISLRRDGAEMNADCWLLHRPLCELFLPELHCQRDESEIRLMISDSSVQCQMKKKKRRQRENDSLWRRNSQEMKGHTWKKIIYLMFMPLPPIPQVQFSIRLSKRTIYENLGQVTAWILPAALAMAGNSSWRLGLLG